MEKSPVTKIAIVLLLFISLLTFCIGFFARSVGRLAGAMKLPNTQAASTPAEPLFYQAVGVSPLGDTSRGQITLQSAMFTLELGVVARQDAAKKLVADLRKLGVSAFYTPVQEKDGRVIFRVRTGAFPSQEAANQEVLALGRKQLAAKVIAL